jgi:lipoate-protein ligase A
LRDTLEKENKDIREKIVWAAIANSLDANWFSSIDTDNLGKNQENNQIDFDKDIDEILKEIENDPELKIDEEEIAKILKEIEEETESELEEPKPMINLDPEAIKKAKKHFKK